MGSWVGWGLRVALILMVSGCASTPVLYPNSAYENKPMEARTAEVQACKALAKEHGIKPGYGSRLARQAILQALVGGAGGFIAGRFSGRTRRSAIVGAAAGGGRGLVQGFNAIQQGPTANYRRFVEQCLRSKGYRPVGWK